MSDGAGEVLAVGAGVGEFAVGDLVVSTFFPDWLDGDFSSQGFRSVPGDGVDGFAREVVTMPATAFTPAPKGWSAAEAATITCAGVTAWRALVVNGGLKAGDSVLIQGSGGVSLYALQLAKLMGARVIATSSSDAKLERLRALGAEQLINYRSEPQWGKKVLDLTNGRGVDHVVEIGGAGTLPLSITAARIGGHIALIGVLAGISGAIPTAALMSKQIRLIGLTVGSRRHQRDLIRAVEVSGMRPVMDVSFPLAELGSAFEYEVTGRHFGKIAIAI